MNRRFRRATKRNPGSVANLSPELERNLSAYVNGALAAGVGLLAITRSAEAKIVYTPANVTLPFNNQAPVLFDLNHDGIADFVFWNTAHHFSEGEFIKNLFVACAPAGGSRICRYGANRVWGKGGFASALVAGFSVGPNKGYFQPGQPGSYVYGALLAGYGGASPSGHTSDGTDGQWFYTKHRYLGLQFIIEGRKHYGWARVAVNLVNGAIEAVLTGYAYETIPDKPIVTGKTTGPDVITLAPDVRANEENDSDAGTAPFAPSLGRLAQGASGIPPWRSRPPRAPAPRWTH